MLRSVVESAGLTFFPAVALVIFVAVFVAVLARELRRPRADAQRMANLPNEEER